MTEKAPADFDWVTARSKCAADVVFEQLRLMAKQNVETFNRRTPADAQVFADGEIGFVDSGKVFKAWSRRGPEVRVPEILAPPVPETLALID